MNASPASAAVAAPKAGAVLRIVAGLHAGASRELGDQEMLVVGSGDDCDIVLADTGVASHHALVTLVGGNFTLRALDAPVRIDGKPWHPGDPVEVRTLQRIDLGEAAIAFGPHDEAAWDALFPAIAEVGRRQKARPLLRRLPLIAAAAVLVLTAVAMIAAFMPRKDNRIDVQAYLQAMIPQHGISQGRITTDVNGVPVLSGTVPSDAARTNVQRELREAGIEASLALRTGEDVARDVREVFRMAGMTVQTRYLGDGRVEINGAVDQDKFQKVLQSRAIADVGAAALVPGTSLTGKGVAKAAAPDEKARAAAAAPVDIVAVVRGREPYVVDSNGVQYPDGAMIPGHGRLVGIGSRIYVEGAGGEIRQIRPITAAELAARAAASDFSNVIGSAEAHAADDAGAMASQQPVNPGGDKMRNASRKRE